MKEDRDTYVTKNRGKRIRKNGNKTLKLKNIDNKFNQQENIRESATGKEQENNRKIQRRKNYKRKKDKKTTE